MVYVFLAEGFEEIEALGTVDILRRAGLPVKTVSIDGTGLVKGAHDIEVKADVANADFTLPDDAIAVVLPGGGLGTENLAASDMIKHVLAQARQKELYIAAICAAPTVLHQFGLLKGKTVTAFPTVQSELADADVTGSPAEIDGKIITGRSAGSVMAFAALIIKALKDKTTANTVIDNLYPQ